MSEEPLEMTESIQPVLRSLIESTSTSPADRLTALQQHLAAMLAAASFDNLTFLVSLCMPRAPMSPPPNTDLCSGS